MTVEMLKVTRVGQEICCFMDALKAVDNFKNKKKSVEVMFFDMQKYEYEKSILFSFGSSNLSQFYL